MIIYGTKGKSIHVADGDFFCPRCNSEQDYKHFQVKNYFTLYFIPVFPIGKGEDYLECGGCKQAWSQDILHYDPVAEMEESIANYQRLAVLFLLDVGRCTSSTLSSLKDVLDELFEIDVEKSDIANDVKMAQSASPEIKKFFKAETQELDVEGKVLLIQILKQSLESEGPLHNSEQRRIIELGKVTGLRAKQIQPVLDA